MESMESPTKSYKNCAKIFVAAVADDEDTLRETFLTNLYGSVHLYTGV